MHRCALLALSLSTASATSFAEEPRTSDAPSLHPSSAEEQSRAAFESGEHHYERGEFRAAADAFRRAHSLLPEAALLYNLAQAERLDGRCELALSDYVEFVTSYRGEKPSDIDDKIAQMKRCVDAHRVPNRVEPIVREPGTPSRQAEAPSARSADEKPDHRSDDRATVRLIAVGMLGGAAVSAALGALFVVRAHSANEQLAGVNRPGGQWGSQYESYQSSLELSRDAELGCFVASGVLAGAAAWLLFGPLPHSKPRTPAVGVAASGRSVTASAMVQF